jgi:hypothetical protein
MLTLSKAGAYRKTWGARLNAGGREAENVHLAKLADREIEKAAG